MKKIIAAFIISLFLVIGYQSSNTVVAPVNDTNTTLSKKANNTNEKSTSNSEEPNTLNADQPSFPRI